LVGGIAVVIVKGGRKGLASRVAYVLEELPNSTAGGTGSGAAIGAQSSDIGKVQLVESGLINKVQVDVDGRIASLEVDALIRSCRKVYADSVGIVSDRTCSEW
jgi:hypothetical protein